MIEIPADHCRQIGLPVLPPVSRVIIFAFVVVPHVPALIHHVHTECVTGIQQSPVGRIVRAADRIKASLLQLLYPPPFELVKSSCSDDSAVLMNAASAEQHFLPVDLQSAAVFRDRSDPEQKAYLIRIRAGSAGIQLRRLCIPQLYVRDFQFQLCAIAACDLLPPVKDGNIGRFHGLHANDRRFCGKCRHLYGFRLQDFSVSGPHPYRPVDSCACIPAGIRLVFIVALHTDTVLPLREELIGTDKERNVSVSDGESLPVINIDPGIFIYALELENDMLRIRTGEPFFIDIRPAGKIRLRTAGRRIRFPVLMNHGIVRQCDSRRHVFFTKHPSAVKAFLFHENTP